MHHDWNNMLVLNGNIVTDTFFLLSGVLLAYTELSKKDRAALKWRFNVIGLYIHRYIRYVYAYATELAFLACNLRVSNIFHRGPQIILIERELFKKII